MVFIPDLFYDPHYFLWKTKPFDKGSLFFEGTNLLQMEQILNPSEKEN